MRFPLLHLRGNKVQFFVSAGEASGDSYAAAVVGRLSTTYPSAKFYGCAGPKLQAAGVKPVVDSARLAVVGMAESVHHLPGSHGEYCKLVRFVDRIPPSAALCTVGPDLLSRLARLL